VTAVDKAAASMIVSAAGTVALAWVSRPADETAVRLSARMTSASAVPVIAAGAAACLWIGLPVGAVLACGVYLLVRGMRGWFYRRRGGITGAGLAASVCVLEALALTILFGLARMMK